MNNFILYLVQSSALLSVLFIIYWFFLKKETFFHLNRFYLIFTAFLSLVIPLWRMKLFYEGPLSSMTLLLDPIIITPEKIEKVASLRLTWFEVAGIIYFIGVALLLLRFFVRLMQLWIITRQNEVRHQQGMNIVFVDRKYSPFSFFTLVFINKEYYTEGTMAPILAHEKVHIQQLHTFDLLLTEILIIVQWFNPFAWLLERSMKGVHEFLADEGVLKEGFRQSEYQSLIFNEAMGLQVNSLTNNFNLHLIKKRVIMMTKNRSAAWTRMKVVLAFPAVLAVLFLFSSGQINQLSAQEQQLQKSKPATVKKDEAKTKTVQEKEVFTVVEKQPVYPGGESARIDFMMKNIKYPQMAKQKNIQGAVFVTFVVETDGSITNVNVLRGIGGGCDEEAVRVIKLMPKWIPGLQKGKAVRVQFNLPIRFRLDADEKPKVKEEKK